MGALRTRLSAVAVLCGGLSCSLVTDRAFAREEPVTAVADLRYGAALYNYYLDDYLNALTELMIADERGGIDGHGDNPEIMEGGLAMGYGMERHASEIFDRLLAENRSVEVRDSAWFYLARMRYTHSEWSRAEEALNKISKKPVKKLRLHVAAMRINVMLKQDRPADAAELLDDTRFPRSWLPYFYFNIGSAYARAKDYVNAVEYFEYLANDEYLTEEHRALYDKAMTGAGYAYLFQQRYQEAKDYFSRVRLNSALKNRALLGYGWASAELGEYQEALKPWKHLAEGGLVDENNQEAMIAVPYAYEKLGAESLALEHYKKAETSFLEEIQKIDEVLVTLRNEDLLSVLQVEARGEFDWLSFAEEKQLSPRLTYLVQLFSRDSFQSSVHEFQDLLAIRDALVEWQDKLAFYSDMLDTREQFRVDKAEQLKVSELKDNVASMREKRKEYAQKIETIAAEKDFFALATDDEQDLIKRALRGEKNIERLRESDPFIDEYEESVRRYRGLLLWQASETYSDRLWQAIKNLNKLDRAIEDLDKVEKSITYLTVNAPDLDPYRGKMAVADEKLLGLNIRIDAAIRKNEKNLKDEVFIILHEQRRKLTNYLAQSRLAVARIYDKARKTHEDQEFEQRKREAEAKKLEAVQEQAVVEQTAPLLPEVPEESPTPTEENTEGDSESNDPTSTNSEQGALP